MSILIKGGRVINPATQMEEEADVLIEEDKVVEMKKNIEEKADRVLDASGCYVMPGFIDMHVHFQALSRKKIFIPEWKQRLTVDIRRS